MSSFTWLSLRKRRWASHSNQKPTQVARMMAQMMPTDSVKSLWTNPMMSDSTAASRRMRMIGSRNFSSSRRQAESSFGGVMTLSP